MYIRDGIAYAGEPEPILKIVGVRAEPDWKLWVRFSSGEQKIVDCKPLLGGKVFEPLKDPAVFSKVYLDRGVVTWADGAIDIAPEYLFENGEIL